MISLMNAEIVVDQTFDNQITPNGALSVVAGDLDSNGAVKKLCISFLIISVDTQYTSPRLA